MLSGTPSSQGRHAQALKRVSGMQFAATARVLLLISTSRRPWPTWPRRSRSFRDTSEFKRAFVMAVRFPRYTAARRQKVLAEAEKAFGRCDLKRGNRKYVSLRTSEIKKRLELFQPREFSYGARSVDGDWVKELARRIGIHGELDPVLVIRLGKEWVCVDGHHRIAAYRVRNHKKPIRCEWFAGTPAEAVDECMRRNSKDHLPIPLEDRCEEAWRRVLLSQGSKKEISAACSISTSTVANMRKAKRDYERDPKFAARVGRPLLETSWGLMLLARGNVDEKLIDLDESAEQLARTIRRRLSDLL